MRAPPEPFEPAGAERPVQLLGATAIDGAPVAYIVVLSAVVTTLAFIPFTVVLSAGGSFPMSQGIFALLGMLLGPIAGAVASGIGTLIGVFVAPHTAGLWPLSVLGAVTASFAGGCCTGPGWRRYLYLPVLALGLVSLAVYYQRALYINHIPPRVIFFGSVLDWSSLLLFATPLRGVAARLVRSPRKSRMALGLALGTWMGYGIAHAVGDAVAYYLFNWPEKIWVMLIPIIPLEMLFRCAVGVVVGTGVIAGLRAIGLFRPRYAMY
jgi:hypothetical protein